MIVGAGMRTAWMLGAAVLLVGGAIAGANAASAAPGGDCPPGPISIGLVCHETEPAPVAPDTGHRLAVVKACIDAQLARLVGVQTGHGFIPSQDDLIKVELYCQAPVLVTPVPVPVPVEPPSAEQNLNNNPTPVPVTG